MAKRNKQSDKRARERSTKALRRLERRLDELQDEQRALRKRVKRLRKLTERRGERGRPPFPPGPPFGRRPWAAGLGPVVSLEVPLETDDPSAPLWATVAARLPEEITTVDDDGALARYRYSAAGSTPQAPRYRRLTGTPEAAPPEGPKPFPG